ncbi:MAG: hypothetical protein LPH21_14555 [Shewanella sp.]|nr:hypothetical protein [Shewanella sp.]
MKSLVLEPQPLTISAQHSERSCKIIRTESDSTTSESLLWFQFAKEVTPPDDDDCDAYLLATIMDAMKENRCIEVQGRVSKTLLSNLVEYQAAWSKWLPDTYQPVAIHCQQIQTTSAKVDGAICAFSGGVDSTFSVWMHTQKRHSYRSQKIQSCAIVHGFDIPLKDSQAFNNAANTAQSTLADVNLSLLPIKTNYLEIAKVSWEHAFSCALVATLSNFKSIAGHCIVGSGEPYDSLVIPCGSSPITGHLLSSDDFNVIHDGASHSRTEKVRDIADWQAGLQNLRVCWQGDLKDKNCGKCEKCVRTKLNFLATNNPIPACFPESDILKDLKGIKLKNHAIIVAEWKQIYQFANQHNINAPWLDQVKNIIEKKVRKAAIRNLINAYFK